MLAFWINKAKSIWAIGLLGSSILCSAGAATAQCVGWPEQGSYSLSGFWEVEYDLTGSEFETRNTPLGAADTTHVVGPGSMTIRFESDASGANGSVLEGGGAQIVHLALTQQFTLGTRVLGFRADVTTQLRSNIPDNRWDGNPGGRVSAGSSGGNINGEILTVAAPGMRSYRTLGSLLCEGSGCRFGRMLPGEPSTIDNDFDVIALRALYFGPGGPQSGAGFASNEIALPLTPRADPYLRLLGREVGRVYVPPSSAETAIATRPCYSVVE